MYRLLGLPAVVAVASAATAQQVRTDQLRTAEVRFDESFSTIAGLRELGDGRVLVTDRLEQIIWIVDLASGTRRPVGRQGQGPGEFGSPGPLFALPGDSSLMLDFGNFRGVVITPDGQVGETVPLQLGGDLLLVPRATDARGRLYVQNPIRMSGGAAPSTDSLPIVRWTRGSDHLDTVAYVAASSSAGIRVIRTQPGGRLRGQGGPMPYGPEDAWAVARDGRVAVVGAAEYRVRWIGPDGRAVDGPPTPYERVRVGSAEKEAWANAQAGMVMQMRTPTGSQTMRQARPDISEQDWPEFKSPFEPRDVFTTPEGELWVGKTQPAGADAPVFDVFDGRGQLIRHVALPAGRRVVGVGAGTLYAVVRDADDLEWLERYRR